MKDKITNREYLNTLSNEEFSAVICSIVIDAHYKNDHEELDASDIAINTCLDIEEWLESEHKK